MIDDSVLRATLSRRALDWVRTSQTIDEVGPLWEAALAVKSPS